MYSINRAAIYTVPEATPPPLTPDAPNTAHTPFHPKPTPFHPTLSPKTK